MYIIHLLVSEGRGSLGHFYWSGWFDMWFDVWFGWPVCSRGSSLIRLVTTIRMGEVIGCWSCEARHYRVVTYLVRERKQTHKIRVQNW